MYSVKVPASSANLGSGFDVLGIALQIFNEYSFEKSENFELSGFASRYLDVSKNLVLSCYKKAFAFAKQKEVPVKITEVCCNIPRSGGLGSSSACVVAGILGANQFLTEKLSSKQMFELATQIEGHPDNIAPALFGGLMASYKTEKGYLTQKYSVSPKLNFLIAYPDFYVSTESARRVLPKSYGREEVVENMSRIVNLPRAFEKGDLELLRECVKDNLHEPFRKVLIDEYDKIKAVADENNCVTVISGSGSALLIISDDKENLNRVTKVETTHKWTFSQVKPYNEVKL